MKKTAALLAAMALAFAATGMAFADEADETDIPRGRTITDVSHLDGGGGPPKGGSGGGGGGPTSELASHPIEAVRMGPIERESPAE
jgi:Spy/CpxP family protein refolding chaperone